MHKTSFTLVALALFSITLWGQQANPPNANDQAALEQRIRDLEDRVIALEGKLRTIQSTRTAQPQPATETQVPVPQAAQVPAVPATVPAQPSPNEAQAGLAVSAGELPVYGGAAGA